MDLIFILIGVFLLIKLVIVLIYVCCRTLANKTVREAQMSRENHEIQRSGNYAVNHVVERTQSPVGLKSKKSYHLNKNHFISFHIKITAVILHFCTILPCNYRTATTIIMEMREVQIFISRTNNPYRVI